MNYPLNPMQKSILAAAGEDVNFRGDDNDLGCLLSKIALKHYAEGDLLKAWNCYQNDPTACYGVTFAGWEAEMRSVLIRHYENERAAKAHH
jgi:hypothetical protein